MRGGCMRSVLLTVYYRNEEHGGPLNRAHPLRKVAGSDGGLSMSTAVATGGVHPARYHSDRRQQMHTDCGDTRAGPGRPAPQQAGNVQRVNCTKGWEAGRAATCASTSPQYPSTDVAASTEVVVAYAGCGWVARGGERRLMLAAWTDGWPSWRRNVVACATCGARIYVDWSHPWRRETPGLVD